MRSSRPAVGRPIASLLVLLSVSTVGCEATGPEAGASRTGLLQPPPTEHRLAADAEESNKQRRKDYVSGRHWAGPDVDWKRLEQDNAARNLGRRNQLAPLSAQASSWTELGSRNQAGRTHVAVPSTDGTELYVGSSKGGVWRGDPDGNSWTPIGDNLYGGAHWLAVTPGDLPGDPDIVFTATDGGSLLVSLDDGATWNEPAGLPLDDLFSVRRVAQSTDGGNRVYLVAGRWFWSGSWTQVYDVYRSLDGGRSFNSVLPLGTYGGDLFVPRDGGSSLFAILGTGVERSDDHGDSWTALGNPDPSGSNAELTGSEAGAPTLYAVVTAGGGDTLYRSDDAGLSWVSTSSVSDYWGTLSASILNPNLVQYGGVEAWRSLNGGANFTKINSWGAYYSDPANRLHADLPGMNTWLDGAGGEVWYYCTDGGLYDSTNGGASVSNLSLDGLRISQYYSTFTSATQPDAVAAGAQDQGYQVSLPPSAAGTSLLDFDQVISGDYGHLVSGDGGFDYVFSVYPGFVLVQRGFDNPQISTVDYPDGVTPLWLPPLCEDTKVPSYFFFCERYLWRYRKAASSNNWTPYKFSSQDFEVDAGERLSALEFSPLDDQLAFAATTRGRLYRSTDRAQTWTLASGVGPQSHYFYGTALLASKTDLNTVWVGGSGYSNAAVFRSTDGGASFQPYGDGLPPTLVYSLAEAGDGSGVLFCGTEQSAYRRDPGSPAWVEITGNQAPVTTYWSAEDVPAAGVVRFGTYGRGIFDYHYANPCPLTAYGVGAGAAQTLQLASASNAAVGETLTFELSGGSPNTGGFFGLSAGEAALPLLGGTLLLDLTTLLIDPLGTDASGGAVHLLPIPGNPNLAGAELFFQAFLIDALQPEGVSFSNGVRGVFCP